MLVVKKLLLQRLGLDEIRCHAGKIVLEKLYYAGGVGF